MSEEEAERVRRTLDAQGMCNAGRNDDTGIVRPAAIVAFEKKPHHATGQSCTLVAKQHLDISLDEKHRVPLFACVRTEREILWLLDEKPAKPNLRRRARWNVRRVNVKAFGGVREHSRGRPLLRPQADGCERPVVLSCELAEESAMTLRKNSPCENFDAGNPRALYIWP